MKEQTNKELLSLTNDYVFRRIFGQKNLSALADFLANVLDMTVEELGDLHVDDPNIHREHKKGKSNVLDIRVHTNSGEIINVEVQVNPERGFRKRLAYLNSKAFSGQLNRGKAYWMLNRTITIVVATIDLIEENRDCLNRFQWYNINDGTLLTDSQEINVLELSKLPQENDGSELWKWLRFFKSGREDEMEELAKDNDEMKKVMVTLREMSADEYERRLAEQLEKDEWDKRAQIEYGRQEGIKIGEARGIEIGEVRGIEIGEVRGIEIGEAKAKQETAQRMREKGYSEDEIAEIM